MTHFISYTRNNVPVFIDLIRSNAAKHVAQQPYLLTLTAEALKNITLDGHSSISIVHDMGRPIGYDFVVETSTNDGIFYAQLVRDEAYTRFIKNGKPLSTQYLTTILTIDSDGALYNVESVWIGRLTPPLPGSAKENTKSKPYWDKHAYVYENQPIKSSTLTKTCPY